MAEHKERSRTAAEGLFKGRLVINDSMTVNGAFEAPSPEPDGWLVLDDDVNHVSLEARVPRRNGR